jgi:sugar lactone lactonase YvrE
MPTARPGEPTFTVARHEEDHLGEGPTWDAPRGDLIWVDINGGAVHRWNLESDNHRQFHVAGEVSAAVPRSSGGLLLAVGHELRLAADDGDSRLFGTVEANLADNRFNDCRCDPQGRLWAGTMSKRRQPGRAALYRVSGEGEIVRSLAGTTISNGLGWSVSGERMYFVDSTTQRIDVFDFNQGDGTLAGRRALVEIDPADGLPDGIAVDAEDGVWVALFGGGAVRRYSAGGELDAVVELPVSNPTCPAFAGPALDLLYVTSARHRLSPAALEAQPLAGALFTIRPGVPGRPLSPFAG